MQTKVLLPSADFSLKGFGTRTQRRSWLTQSQLWLLVLCLPGSSDPLQNRQGGRKCCQRLATTDALQVDEPQMLLDCNWLCSPIEKYHVGSAGCIDCSECLCRIGLADAGQSRAQTSRLDFFRTWNTRSYSANTLSLTRSQPNSKRELRHLCISYTKIHRSTRRPSRIP
jgi:hypothetical protein